MHQKKCNSHFPTSWECRSKEWARISGRKDQQGHRGCKRDEEVGVSARCLLVPQEIETSSTQEIEEELPFLGENHSSDLDIPHLGFCGTPKGR